MSNNTTSISPFHGATRSNLFLTGQLYLVLKHIMRPKCHACYLIEILWGREKIYSPCSQYQKLSEIFCLSNLAVQLPAGSSIWSWKDWMPTFIVLSRIHPHGISNLGFDWWKGQFSPIPSVMIKRKINQSNESVVGHSDLSKISSGHTPEFRRT